jgi:hypothetical protein
MSSRCIERVVGATRPVCNGGGSTVQIVLKSTEWKKGCCLISSMLDAPSRACGSWICNLRQSRQDEMWYRTSRRSIKSLASGGKASGIE